MNKKGQTWFLVIVSIVLILGLLIELGFLGMFYYSCYEKNQCMIPFFFGFGRYMAFPMVWGSSSEQIYNFHNMTQTQECYLNGNEINCSDMNYGS